MTVNLVLSARCGLRHYQNGLSHAPTHLFSIRSDTPAPPIQKFSCSGTAAEIARKSGADLVRSAGIS